MLRYVTLTAQYHYALWNNFSSLLCLRQFNAALLCVSLKYSKENPLGFLVILLQMQYLPKLENSIESIFNL